MNEMEKRLSEKISMLEHFLEKLSDAVGEIRLADLKKMDVLTAERIVTYHRKCVEVL